MFKGDNSSWVHGKEQRDEAISILSATKYEIASSQKTLLAMTICTAGFLAAPNKRHFRCHNRHELHIAFQRQTCHIDDRLTDVIDVH